MEGVSSARNGREKMAWNPTPQIKKVATGYHIHAAVTLTWSGFLKAIIMVFVIKSSSKDHGTIR